MKPSKIFWGVFFLGLGALLLVKNFSDVDFYLPEIRKFWPLLLIAGGVVYLTKKPDRPKCASGSCRILPGVFSAHGLSIDT